MISSAPNPKVREAQQALEGLDFDRERTNERSALVLLALLDLAPDTPWSEAGEPLLRTVELMDWIGQHYGRNYKPNTRETIRRQTLHQFVDAGLVLLNPDQPDRPINSPKSCYQIAPKARGLLVAFEASRFDGLLTSYLEELPGLRSQYERARVQRLVPVTLPDGSTVSLTPGGQNVLIGQILKEFCPRFTPAAHILYVGDAGRQDPIFNENALEELGVSLDKHGKLPDLIAHLPDREWLVLIEAASSHGPVNGKRRDELERLFLKSSAGLVFVSCFPSRAEMRGHLDEIAWETEVWCADNPSHLIHFNGERFLGPYETRP